MIARETSFARRGWPLLVIVLSSALLHGEAIDDWWRSDDPQVLLQAVRTSPADVLFEPHAWRTLSTSSFTPLVTISFDADLELAGVNPAPFYIHQWIALTCAALLIYLLVVPVSRAAGTTSALVFLALPPVAVAARSLMLRHYVEGLVFALIAVWAWTRNSGRDRVPAAWLTILCTAAYLLSMLAKEVYAPLPVVLIAVSIVMGERPRRWITRMIPLGIVAILYVTWRTWMLGDAGGYGGGFSLAQVARLPLRVLTAMLGDPDGGRLEITAAGVFVVIAIAVVVPVLRGRWSSFLIGLGASAILVLLPLLFVGAEFDRRYAFVAAAVGAVAVGLAGGLASRQAPSLVLQLALVAVTAFLGVREILQFGRETRPMIAEGRYVWQRRQTAPVLLAGSPGWYLAGLDELRRLERLGRPPRYVLSRNALVLGAVETSAVAAWDDEARRIVPLDPAERGAVESEKARLDPDGDLSLRFDRVGSALQWTLGPPGGTFTLVTVPLYDDFPIPETGWRRLPEAVEAQAFRIRRDAPDGSWVISPVFNLPVHAGAPVGWSRVRRTEN